MTDARYTIGLDYGSLSCRGVLARTADGRIVAEAALSYPHGILDRALPDGTPLDGAFCLQCPADYALALTTIVPELLRESGVDPAGVVGIGLDFTASTVIPLDAAYRPLAENPAFASRPHAWCKLWKHHGAAAQAEALTDICRAQKRPYLDWYGGRVSPECLTAKVAQVFAEDRAVYDAADAFVEAGDYVTSLLAGKPVFGASLAAAKALWSKESGYPDAAFFGAFDPDFADMPRRKLADRFGATPAAPATRVGGLCPDMARRLGLPAGIAVASPQMDAYTPMLALGIARPAAMLLVIGTSTGIVLLGDKQRPVEGVTACVPETYYPRLWGYGSGQASVGDCFQWFTDTCLPASYRDAARDAGLSPQQYLTWLAEPLAPGATGLLALDWFNGNRSCLGNSRLSGMIVGLTLRTRPEHLYRALLEATAFGARAVLSAYRAARVPVNELFACGGIPEKNPLMMQIYADALQMPLKVSLCRQAPALGAAICAAAAAGGNAGRGKDTVAGTGFADVFEAVDAMQCRDFRTYTPDAGAAAAYDALYREYIALHDYFGRGQNRVMERLRG